MADFIPGPSATRHLLQLRQLFIATVFSLPILPSVRPVGHSNSPSANRDDGATFELGRMPRQYLLHQGHPGGRSDVG